MTIKLYLIRHGKTKGNESGRYIGGRTDEPLSKMGKDELLEKSLKYGMLFDKDNSKDDYKLFSSPMLICIETCSVLFPNKDIIQVPYCKEIDFGVFENHNYEELNGREDYQRWIDSGGKSDYPNGEKLCDFIERNMKGANFIFGCLANGLRDKTCAELMEEKLDIISENAVTQGVLVCHGGTIMAIMSELKGGEYFDFQVKNGDGYFLEIEKEEESVSVISYNRI